MPGPQIYQVEEDVTNSLLQMQQIVIDTSAPAYTGTEVPLPIIQFCNLIDIE